MSRLERSHLWLVRDPEPLGSYVRPLARDSKLLTDLLVSGLQVGSGVVLDARAPDRTVDLREAAREAQVEIVLDPNSVELSTAGGIHRSGVLELPWGGGELNTPDSLGTRTAPVAERIATTAVGLEVDAVLAPSHFLESFPSPWLSVDLELSRALRTALDQDNRGRRIRIYYPFISTLTVASKGPVLSRICAEMAALRDEEVIDAVWLRMHAFGSRSSGRINFNRYVKVSRELHSVGLPLIAERTGTVGLALMALGCVAGIESGITHGERCDIRTLQREPRPNQTGFSPAPRVYLPGIGAFLDRESAARFFSTPGIKNWFACQGPCCRKGHLDMLTDPRRHFLMTRASEVRRLAEVPAEMRADRYLSSWLRPASDRAIRAARVLPKLAKQRKILDDWREVFSEIHAGDQQSRPSTSPPITFVDDLSGGRSGEPASPRPRIGS